MPNLVSGYFPQFLNSADGMLKDSFQSPQPMNFRGNESFRPTDNSLFYSPISHCITPQYGGDNGGGKKQE